MAKNKHSAETFALCQPNS